MSEQEEFLKDLSEQKPVDVLEQPLNPEDKPEGDEGAGEGEGTEGEGDKEGIQPKNRRERRLMVKLQAERESSMFLAGKLEARTEAGRAVTEESDYLKAIERIYGTETPEAQIATDLLKKALSGVRDDAENRAYDRIKEEQQLEREQARKVNETLDGFIEDIEDEFSVNLTDAQERAFFQMLEKMSPKDKEGNVIEYADPIAVWEVLQERSSKRTDTRAKDMSSRSMTHSGASKEIKTGDDAAARFLREQGII